MSKQKRQPVPISTVADADQARQQRDVEQKARNAQLARIDYEIALHELGLDEQMELAGWPNTIQPSLKLVQIDEERQKQSLEFLRKMKADLLNMGSGIITDPTAVDGITQA